MVWLLKASLLCQVDPGAVKKPETVNRAGRESREQCFSPSSQERQRPESRRKSWRRIGRTGEGRQVFST